MFKENKKYILLLLIFLMIVPMGIYATITSENNILNKAKMDTVDIKLSEYMIDKEGNEKPFNIDYTLIPGISVSMIPKISNHGAECYIRVKLNISNPKTYGRDLVSDDIYGMSDDWIYRDGFFYYKEPLKEKETVDFYKGFVVPEEWHSDKTENFRIALRAEAIQTRNLKPNFDAEKPWGDVVAEKTFHSRID